MHCTAPQSTKHSSLIFVIAIEQTHGARPQIALHWQPARSIRTYSVHGSSAEMTSSFHFICNSVWPDCHWLIISNSNYSNKQHSRGGHGTNYHLNSTSPIGLGSRRVPEVPFGVHHQRNGKLRLIFLCYPLVHCSGVSADHGPNSRSAGKSRNQYTSVNNMCVASMEGSTASELEIYNSQR